MFKPTEIVKTYAKIITTNIGITSISEHAITLSIFWVLAFVNSAIFRIAALLPFPIALNNCTMKLQAFNNAYRKTGTNATKNYKIYFGKLLKIYAKKLENLFKICEQRIKITIKESITCYRTDCQEKKRIKKIMTRIFHQDPSKKFTRKLNCTNSLMSSQCICRSSWKKKT